MRRLITGFDKTPASMDVSRSFRVWSLVAVAALVPFTSVMADEPARTDAQVPAAGALVHSEAAMIPACFEGLQLSSEQQTKVREIIATHDAKIAKVWKHFGKQYQETIAVESLLLAAIEDNLSDEQRSELRAQRRQVAMDEKANQEKKGQPNKATTEKPESAVKEASGAGGVTLSAEQQAAADKLQEKYLTRLRSLNRDIQGLHTRLLSLEADKLVEMEKTLTPEQLKQLREVRKNAPADSKITANRTAPVKSE
jgi:hypothetical protein